MKDASRHAPLNHRFLTPGVLVLLAIMAVGAAFAIARFGFGLGAVTNLDNQHPWGIWIAVDVATGVALAAGGFTTAALVYIFNRKYFGPIVRPALLTAWLGYLFVSIGLLADLGRYYNIWHPMIYWQGNSVLFEVGLCVMTYLTVLTIEFLPIVLEGLQHHVKQGSKLAQRIASWQKPAQFLHDQLERVMPVFIIAGVVLSCMHQSALGTLMLIAPTKLDPLWFTPILPLLFLTSAIMVGFPMVIFESLIAAKTFKHKPEIHVLSALARYVPYFIGLYLILKLGDWLIRYPISSLTLNVESVSFLVEIGFGVILPLILFLNPKVRQSVTGLFTASSLVIFGIVLNRINVFLVGYNPPFAESSYFPSIGELAITAGLIAAIVFFYRAAATLFPVLPAHEAESVASTETVTFRTPEAGPAWGKQVSVLLLVFVGLGAMPVSASSGEEQDKMPSLLWLEHSLLNQDQDLYGAVRFMHKKHAHLEANDCSVCHHRAPQFNGDQIGKRVSRSFWQENQPAKCSECHTQPMQPDRITRPGLKGALHQNCIDCHTERQAGPQSCAACHQRNVPDHSSFIKVQEDVTPQAITNQCLECHESVQEDILQSAHWKWEGHSPDTLHFENHDHLGKKRILNNYCIHVGSNLERCTMCHVGYGWKDDSFDFDNASNIDCLVCHDTTGEYKKAKTGAGYPTDDVDLVAVAKQVGHTSRKTCGACHFYGGGGDGVKHGDLDSSLLNPSPELDVHMGKHNFDCQDCHQTKDHQIAGACQAIPAREGRVSCQDCHTETPHHGNSMLSHHLNEHTKTIECQTCHIPEFARGKPTKLEWDWSKAGLELAAEEDQYGKPVFMKKKGSFVWGKNVVPTYLWDNGKHKRYVLGDPLNQNGPTVLNQPLGNINDPNAKIAPYKVHRATQISDKVNDYLIVPNLWKGYWKHYDWDQAAQKGMQSVGLAYSGEYEFVQTQMHWKLNHQVAPKDHALSCYQCHDQRMTCTQCHTTPSQEMHQKLVNIQEAQLAKNRGEYHFPFRQLGYPEDPIHQGGRFQDLHFKNYVTSEALPEIQSE